MEILITDSVQLKVNLGDEGLAVASVEQLCLQAHLQEYMRPWNYVMTAIGTMEWAS
jgi:hypothetical protein